MLGRRASFALPLMLASCAEDEPAARLEPVRYDYLVPLRLNVATIDYSQLPAPSAGEDGTSAGPALQQLAQDRLSPGGSSGRAVVTIEDARIIPRDGGLDGAMSIRLDVLSAAGSPAGYAEARVARRRTGRASRAVVQAMTRQMLDDMNVELEYQIRRSLREYLQVASPAPAPAPVTRQDLGAPLN